METPSFSLIDKQEHIELAARALKSIAHPLRLKILCVLGEQEACVQEIVDAGAEDDFVEVEETAE